MAVEAASSTVFALSLAAISALTLLLLRHYLPIRSTPAYLLLPIFLALALPCSIILLVPIDLATNSVEDEDGVARGISLPDGFMTAMWRIAYWLTFVLTWYDKFHEFCASFMPNDFPGSFCPFSVITSILVIARLELAFSIQSAPTCNTN